MKFIYDNQQNLCFIILNSCRPDSYKLIRSCAESDADVFIWEENEVKR